MTTMTIGQLAQLTGTNMVTIRYYEKQNLLPDSTRSSGGHRLYSENTIVRLHFIKNAKTVGFTLEEIKDLLALQDNKKGSRKQVKDRVLAKLEVVREKLQAVQEIYSALESLVASCDGKASKGSICECPILKTLNKTNDIMDKPTRKGVRT